MIHRSTSRKLPLIGRASLFVLVFSVLQVCWQIMGDGIVRSSLIDVGTVAPAVSLVHALTPNVEVRAIGNRLWETNGGLNIVSGCDGMETLFLLVAGFAVAPLPLRARINGVLLGLPIVYVLNLARILTLFYAHHSDAALFDLLHGIVTPVLMVLSIAAFYYAWLRRSRPTAAESSP